MNILIPHSWLLEHLETNATPEQLQEHLSLCGPSVERIYHTEHDHVYDIEITTNRPDSLSVRGIAREAAVILTQAGIPSQLKPGAWLPVAQAADATINTMSDTPDPLFPQITTDPALSRRVMAVLLKNVQHSPTPDWMARRLQQTEMSVHNAMIDITNYITHELGHPCHAFDADKLAAQGASITITTATAGQSFTTLDGEHFTTVGGEVVFVNPSGEIIDLPSIKGTQNTSVDDQTQNVLLLMESVMPEKVRFASMTHGIRTMAAQLMEKGVSPVLMDDVLSRGIQLYQELCGAQVAGPVFDEFSSQTAPTPIVFPLSELTRYLGVTLSTESVVQILTSLGCSVVADSQKQLQITPPSFRNDLAISADIVEEIARIYGYHRLPSALMESAIPTNRPENTEFWLEYRTKQLLADLGYQENYTYSMVSAELAQNTPEGQAAHLRLNNPLTQDAEYLRRHIVPSQFVSMKTQLEHSPLQGTFELAHVYEPREGQLPDEHLVLGIIDRDIQSLRRTLEILIKRLHLATPTLEFSEENTKNTPSNRHFYQSLAFITLNSRVLGTIGYINEHWCGLELDWRIILEERNAWPHLDTQNNTSAVLLDWTIAIPERTPVGQVYDHLRTSSPLVTAVQLTGSYQGNWTFHIKLRSSERQLTQADAHAWQGATQSSLDRLLSKLN